MNKLSPNWITEQLIDFEYKKYILLAYLQDVSRDFEKAQLYPSLGELVDHYRNLVRLRDSKNELYGNFPERIAGADLEKFRLFFRKIIEDDAIMKEVESIIDYSIPEFEKQLMEGRKIYEFIEEHISIHPVGVMPLNATSGYVIFQNGGKKERDVYEFQVTIFENPNERYRGIYTNKITTYEASLSNSYESIKNDLIRFNRNFPNPATFAIESDLLFPFEESLMPVAKRSFVRYLSDNDIC